MLDSERRNLVRRAVPVVLCTALGIGLGIWHNMAVGRDATGPAGVVRTAVAPLVSAMGSAAAWSRANVGSLFRGRSLAAENARLRREIAGLTLDAQALREAEASVARLERELGYVQAARRTMKPARVIALRPSPHFATLALAGGKRDGIRVGSVVVAPDGVCGHVFEVGPTTSSVVLITDPNTAVGALVQRAESRAVGICRGQGSNSLRMSYLSRDADVRVGDRVVTSGLGGTGGVYPKGLVIGMVTGVSHDPTMSTTIATVRPSAPLDRLEEALVLR